MAHFKRYPYTREINRLAKQLHMYAYDYDYYNAIDNNYSLELAWLDAYVGWRGVIQTLESDIEDARDNDNFDEDEYLQELCNRASRIIRKLKALYKVGAIK